MMFKAECHSSPHSVSDEVSSLEDSGSRRGGVAEIAKCLTNAY